MLAKTLVAVILLAGVAAAQDPVRPGGPFVPPYSDLRQYLSLTDVQVRSLEQVQTNRREAESAIYRQTADKQRTLSGLLQAGSTDALQIGQLMVEINNLQRRMPLAAEPYRSAALAVLTEAQKAKLPALAEALAIERDRLPGGVLQSHRGAQSDHRVAGAVTDAAAHADWAEFARGRGDRQRAAVARVLQ
jgi:Spy/CpxP family protein refolding chaperone